MILLGNGEIVDGVGSARRRGSVLIREDLIEAVGAIEPSPDMEVVDCSGLTVAPGFIDVHSHSDLEILEQRPEKVHQGVTTEVVGNCGFSLFPKLPSRGLVPAFNLFERRGERGWRDADEYFRDLESRGARVNCAALTGHATLRASILGVAALEPDPEALDTMKRTLSACLEQGALGMSTGLNEAPSCYAGFDELLSLAGVLRRYGAFYTSHLRDYKFRVLDAVAEALELGRRAQVPVQLSHFQVAGRRNWDKMDTALELVERASADGVDVGIDAYPYLAGSCQLTQLLPAWALEGGTSVLLRRLEDRDQWHRIAEETEAGMANGWEQIFIASAAAPHLAAVAGRSIAQIAVERHCCAVDAALQVLRESGGSVWIISFNQSEENLRKVLTHPLTCIITDGLWTAGKPHPRTFGTYPTWLGECVRERRWLGLEQAIHKVTGLPARRFRLHRRGVIRPGCFADVTIFDAKTIGTRATYLEPNRPPEGILHVLVNGRWALRDGRLLPVYAGRALRLAPAS